MNSELRLQEAAPQALAGPAFPTLRRSRLPLEVGPRAAHRALASGHWGRVGTPVHSVDRRPPFEAPEVRPGESRRALAAGTPKSLKVRDAGRQEM